MSNYPDNCPSGHDVLMEFDCLKCGHHWEAEGRWDLGMYDLKNEEEGKCPQCGEWPT